MMRTLVLVTALAASAVSRIDAQLPVYEPKGESTLRVFVRKPDDKPLRRCRVRLLRGSEGTLASTNRPAVDVEDTSAGHLFEHLAAGSYVVEATAPGFAKTFSKTVIVSGDADDRAKITFKLLVGGTITGRVVDAKGKGLAGATVTTADVGTLDNPMMKLFPGVLFSRISLASGRTDKDGKFAIPHVAPGTYKLRFTHPEHVRVIKTMLGVLNTKTLEIDPVQLATGARIHGRVTCEGKPVPDAEITLLAKGTLERCIAVSDKNGKFVMPERFESGTYSIHANRRDLANPLDKMVQLQASRQELEIVSPESHEVEVKLPK